MNTIEKLHFQALAIDGANYFTWSLDVESHLAAKDLEDTMNTYGCWTYIAREGHLSTNSN